MANPGVKIAITLPDTEVAWLKGLATVSGSPVSKIARSLLIAAIKGADPEAIQAEKEKADKAPPPPRETWPLAQILGDREWFGRWLPQLRQLCGRGGGTFKGAVDRGGCQDWMATLFPGVPSKAGGTRDWLCVDYGHWAQIDSEARHREHAGRHPDLKLGPASTTRAEVWEPAVRAVVLALVALERISEPGRDPFTAIRTMNEIRTTWRATFIEVVGAVSFLDGVPKGGGVG